MKKKVLWSLIIVLTLSGLVYGYSYYYRLKNTPDIENEGKMKVQTPIGLEVVNLGRNNSGDAKSIDKINTDLTKHQFVGAYTVIEKKRVLSSLSNGYANANLKSGFTNNTVIRAGHYQTMINTALLLKELQGKNISLNSKLSKYFHGKSNFSNITVENLIEGKSELSIRASQVSNLNEEKTASDFLKYVSANDTEATLTEKMDATNILIVLLLVKVKNKSYSDILNSFSDKYDLYGTRISQGYLENDRNLAVSYHSSKGNAQDKPYNLKNISYIYGVNQLYMSMSDALNVVYLINTNMLFSKDYNNYWQKFCKMESKSYSDTLIKKEKWSFKDNGYVLSTSFTKNADKVAVVIENYPNSVFSKSKLSDMLLDNIFS